MAAFLSNRPQEVEEIVRGEGAQDGSSERKKGELLKDIQSFLCEGHQVPLLRTFYRRIAFQAAKDNEVYIPFFLPLTQATDVAIFVKMTTANRLASQWTPT